MEKDRESLPVPLPSENKDDHKTIHNILYYIDRRVARIKHLEQLIEPEPEHQNIKQLRRNRTAKLRMEVMEAKSKRDEWVNTGRIEAA